MSVINFFLTNGQEVIDYTVQHFILIGMAIFFATLIWTTVGIIISRYEAFADTILGVGSIIMCIPSIALYGLLLTMPMFGLGRLTALFALVLYSMLPIVRNVYVGLKSVDDSIIESARGVGMSRRKILFDVELPVALPTILAGIRVTLVLIINIATLATFIGEKNLGRLIHHGIARSNMDMIIAGAIMVSLIAILIDGGMELVKRKVVSPGLLQTARGDNR